MYQGLLFLTRSTCVIVDAPSHTCKSNDFIPRYDITIIIDLAAFNGPLHGAKCHNKHLFSKWLFTTDCWFNPNQTISLGNFRNYWIRRWNWCAFLFLFSIFLLDCRCSFHIIMQQTLHHEDVITWRRFPRYWSFVMENPSVTGGFTKQSTSKAELWSFFDVSKKKLLDKHTCGPFTNMVQL